MLPEISVNWYAIVAAVVANIVIGFVWYGPLFGTVWMREMGMAPDFKPDAALLKRSMVLMTAGALLTAIVLAYATEAIRPSSWQAGNDAASAVYGLVAGIVVWIGFYVPMLLGGVAWENRSWKLFGLNAGYHLVVLFALGQILANWR